MGFVDIEVTTVLPESVSPVRRGQHVVIIGGGPGGYEAALVAAQLGARVQLVEERGLGGSAVLTDVVPSKTLIATAQALRHGVALQRYKAEAAAADAVDLAAINARVRALAAEQSNDLNQRMAQKGIEVIAGRACLGDLDASGTRSVQVHCPGTAEVITLHAQVVLLATGARPRQLPQARTDGVRILNWTQLYNLKQVPEHLIVVGSGVTGAEFAGAYLALGAQVTLVSSREHVLPKIDADAAALVEHEFCGRGMQVLARARARAARVVGAGSAQHVEVELEDGRTLTGSHCLMAVGALPSTAELGLENAGVELTSSGHVRVDRVSRTTAYRVYAAGDCTGVLPLASVAAMQGRIAMHHALGDAVAPLQVNTVAQAVFTLPEIAFIGIAESELDVYDAVATTVPLSRNPRAKMMGITAGFIKLFSQRRSGEVLGGVVAGAWASEQILAITLAVTHRLTVEQIMNAFSVYPSLSGSITEAARQLHVR